MKTKLGIDMDTTKERFIMTDGYISVNNEKLFIEVNSSKKDYKDRGGWLGILLALVGLSIFRTLRRDKLFSSISDYVDLSLQVIGAVTIIGILYYIFFMRKSPKNLVINELKKIEIEAKDLETEVSLIFNDKRQKDLEFRTHENQLEPFLEALKKRNTRLEIKHI
ncbi:hypothetical protein Q2T40_07390 [Winogradskyella maritima]|uniref:Uncharacterized protein n=1 Tax=Winogradskyella maritima TaxID=1517766 RepID=A0ABV8ANC5_9FLAO|nr:hypothetical protein [Winogradskyella maritima]